MQTDYEKLKALFDKWGVEYSEEGGVGAKAIYLLDHGVDTGVGFEFGSSGKFIETAIGEYVNE